MKNQGNRAERTSPPRKRAVPAPPLNEGRIAGSHESGPWGGPCIPRISEKPKTGQNPTASAIVGDLIGLAASLVLVLGLDYLLRLLRGHFVDLASARIDVKLSALILERVLGMRLAEEVLAHVSHRQWVLTMPKRLRIFFRYDRHLLGKLCRLAYETIRDALCQACGARAGEPGYVGAIQTFGDLMGWHGHIHAIVSEGLFRRDGFFIRISKVDMERCAEMWREKVFNLLLREEKIDEEVVRSMAQVISARLGLDVEALLDAAATTGESVRARPSGDSVTTVARFPARKSGARRSSAALRGRGSVIEAPTTKRT